MRWLWTGTRQLGKLNQGASEWLNLGEVAVEFPIEVPLDSRVSQLVGVLVVIALVVMIIERLDGIAPVMSRAVHSSKRIVERVTVWFVSRYCGCQLVSPDSDDQADLHSVRSYFVVAPPFAQAMVRYVIAIGAIGADNTARDGLTEGTALPFLAFLAAAPMLSLLGDLRRPAIGRKLNGKLRIHAASSAALLLGWTVWRLGEQTRLADVHTTAWVAVGVVSIALGRSAATGKVNIGNRFIGAIGAIGHAVCLLVFSPAQPVTLVIRALVLALAINLLIVARRTRFATHNSAATEPPDAP